MSQRSNEVAKLRCRQGSVDPAVPFGQLRAVVLRAEHYFERPASSEEPGQVLSSTATRKQAEGGLELGEECRFQSCKAHVTREHKLAPRRAHASPDLRDRDEATRTESPK